MKKINASMQHSLFIMTCFFFICFLSISCKNKIYDISEIKHSEENIGHNVNLLVSANDSLFLAYCNENNGIDSVFIYKAPEFIYLKGYIVTEKFSVKYKLRKINKADNVNDLLITYEFPEHSKIQDVSVFSDFIFGFSHDGLGSNQYLIVKYKTGYHLKIKVIDKDNTADIKDVVIHHNSIYFTIQSAVGVDDECKIIYRNSFFEIALGDLERLL